MGRWGDDPIISNLPEAFLMTDTFRAMCAELVDAMAAWRDGGAIAQMIDDLIERARTLLAQPEPEGLTDEEIDGLFEEHCSYCDEGRSALPRWDFHEAVQAAIAADRARRPTPQPPADGEVRE
jgi:hypothetical protein